MSHITEKQIDKIKLLIYDAYHASKDANEVIFRDNHNQVDYLIAATLVNQANSYISAATAIYYSNYEKLENTSVEKIFTTFSTFENEFVKCLVTNHSHQWTNIEFLKFEEAYNYSGIKLGT